METQTKVSFRINHYNDKKDMPTGDRGGFSYNLRDSCFDINISKDEDWNNSKISILAHELKHADQFIHGKISFMCNYTSTPIGAVPIYYDLRDEVEAHQREELFLDTPRFKNIIEIESYISKTYISEDNKKPITSTFNQLDDSSLREHLSSIENRYNANGKFKYIVYGLK